MDAEMSTDSIKDDLESAAAPLSRIARHRKLPSLEFSLSRIMGSSIATSAPGSTLFQAVIDSELQNMASQPWITSPNAYHTDFGTGLTGANGTPSYFTDPAYAASAPPLLTNSFDESSSHASSSQQSVDSSLIQTTLSPRSKGGKQHRVRRKCIRENCRNRVVQGGLCIAHGAKRKVCKHPGCSKNVKQAGLCSTHGPARKRCNAVEGCGKVAVQGGRCIAHGAKKKLCLSSDCTKQAILKGYCKKHYDQGCGASSRSDQPLESKYCHEIDTAPLRQASHQTQHTRGLSLFQEISPDGLQSLLNDVHENENNSASPASVN